MAYQTTKINNSTLTISADTLKAIRKANALTFIFNGEKSASYMGIETTLKGKKRSCESNAYYDLASKMIDYDGTTPKETHQKYANSLKAFVVIDGVNNPVLDTAKAFIKKGDILSVLWVRNNNSPTMFSAGMVCDELRLVIERSKPTGDSQRFEFPLTYQVDNTQNQYRMINYGINENQFSSDPRISI